MNNDNTIRLALVGYGKMGREIHQRIRNNGYPEPIIVDPSLGDVSATLDEAATAEVVIEFTRPDAVAQNLLALAPRGVPIVCGTTGWQYEEGRIRKEVMKHGGALLHAANFSIGVYMLSRLTALAASMADAFQQYDIALHEVHHRGKMDAPSGTALQLAGIIMQHCSRKTIVVDTAPKRALRDEELHVSSMRTGLVTGRHELLLDSDVDALRIIHEAKHRGGFAEGALMAARWIRDKRGIFTLEEMLNDIVAS
jgi:4-hydroxy-tetrahydrodipicolinate reductase